MDEEWGPFIEHDGRGCPCVGKFVHRIFTTDGRGAFQGLGGTESESFGIAMEGPLSAWDWGNFMKIRASGLRTPKIIRYRIRTPRALAELRALIADLPVSVPA